MPSKPVPQSVVDTLAAKAQAQDAEDRPRLGGPIPQVAIPPPIHGRLRALAAKRSREGAYCSITRLVTELLLDGLDRAEKL